MMFSSTVIHGLLLSVRYHLYLFATTSPQASLAIALQREAESLLAWLCDHRISRTGTQGFASATQRQTSRRDYHPVHLHAAGVLDAGDISAPHVQDNK